MTRARRARGWWCGRRGVLHPRIGDPAPTLEEPARLRARPRDLHARVPRVRPVDELLTRGTRGPTRGANLANHAVVRRAIEEADALPAVRAGEEVDITGK